MVTTQFVIGNAGDGSNFIQWVNDPAVLARMKQLADEGEEYYASGDGLQVKTLKFKDKTALTEFEQLNKIKYKTLQEINDAL